MNSTSSTTASAPPVQIAERYYLSTGRASAGRLRVLHSIYGPETEIALCRAGLRTGMRVADIGAGIGLVSRFLADSVGPTGHVALVDGSGEQLVEARVAMSEGKWSQCHSAGSAVPSLNAAGSRPRVDAAWRAGAGAMKSSTASVRPIQAEKSDVSAA